jgi:hypothetical protein
VPHLREKLLLHLAQHRCALGLVSFRGRFFYSHLTFSTGERKLEFNMNHFSYSQSEFNALIDEAKVRATQLRHEAIAV